MSVTLYANRRIAMPRISTLSGQTEFEYTLDGKGGFFIEYTAWPHISREFIQKIQENMGILTQFYKDYLV